jgi:hypothetical protein
VVETPGPCPLLQMHQSDQSPYPVAIPETPLRTLEFIEGMAANPTIGESVDAFRDLLKIRKSHGDVEPIPHVLRFRRYLLLDGSQTDIPIGENFDRRGFGDSALAHGKIDRAHRLGTSIAHEGKTGGIALALEDFARHDLEVSFRPRVSISDVPAIQADYQLFRGLVRRGGSENFC